MLKKQQYEEILPSAQLLLLYFIYSGAQELSTSQASKELGLTPTSISRASRQLEEVKLVTKQRKQEYKKYYFSMDSPKELFQKVHKKLISPVKRTVYIPKEFVSQSC